MTRHHRVGSLSVIGSRRERGGHECWELLLSGFPLRFPLLRFSIRRQYMSIKCCGMCLGELCCIVRLTVPIPSHYIPEARTGSNVSDNPIDIVNVVILSFILAGFLVRAGLFFTAVRFPVGQLIIAMAP